MSDTDVNRWKSELIANGFRPQRFSVPVRIVRRLLWPFVRPFHFYILEELGRIMDRRENEVAALRREIDAVTDRQDVIKSAIERMVSGQSMLRTDVATIVHRHTVIADEIQQTTNQLDTVTARLGAFDQRGQELDQRGQEMATELGTIVEAFGHLDHRSKETATELGAIADRLGQIDHRTKLFLTPTAQGILLLKEGEYVSDTVARSGAILDPHIVEVMDSVPAARRAHAVDVGAHFGLLTIEMARRFAQVISFEPNSFNFAVLTTNVVLNRLGNVRCVNGALYSESTALSLGREVQQEIPLPLDSAGRFDGLESQNLGAFMFTENGSGIFPTQAMTLDSFELADLSFMKIDVQGADGEVIKGAMQTIRRCKPVIVFEWEALLAREFKVTLDDVRAMLSDANYTVEVLKVHNEKQTDYVARPRSA